MLFCTWRNPLVSIGLVLLVVACGKAGDEKATQVVAKVNDDEITVHQVNQALQRLGNVPEAQARDAQKQILDRLVDQQLLLQQARNRKLDRDPGVTAAVEAAKQQIIAQAYMEQVMSAAQKAAPNQVKDFYLQHPELFRDRRVYRFAQIAVAASPDKQQAVVAKMRELEKLGDKQKMLPQLADWLRAQQLQFRTSQTTQGAEQLPLERLPTYQQLKLGDLDLAPGAQGIVVSQLIGIQVQPLSEEQAGPYIEQYLQNRERMKLSEDEMKRLHVAAKIRFLGEFAKLEQPASAMDPSARGAAAAPSKTPAAASDGSAETRENVDQDAMAKGVKALK